jgi:periplasmic protein CpxP/Spy
MNLNNRRSSIKSLPFFLGLVSLTLAASTLFPSFAQSSDPSTRPEHNRLDKGDWKALNLTPDQKTQMKRIRQSSQAQKDAVLTQSQRDLLNAAKGDRENRRQVYATLNLTAAQKAKLKEISRSTKTQMQNILTPEQRQTLEQHRSTQRNKNQSM